ncbi:MAG TPA: Hsp20 family protein [Nitrososphaeraceae archaeon]|nr:Hsp20 family protein [Nitrososphaeraceae archaeon]
MKKDANDDIAAKRIMRLLKANGYLVSKSDVIWILDRMSEELERQIDESNSILERKILCEVITTAKEIRVITELPDVSKEDIDINIYGSDLFINAEGQNRSYFEVIHLPNGISGRGLKSTFLNGVLEVTIKRRSKSK